MLEGRVGWLSNKECMLHSSLRKQDYKHKTRETSKNHTTGSYFIGFKQERMT